MRLTVPDDTDQRRAREYPGVQAQLDMIWKALGLLKTKPWPADVQAMIDQMTTVAVKYPRRP